MMEPIGRLKDEALNSANGEFVRREWEELKDRYRKLVDSRERLGKVKDYFQRKLILENPTMYSVRFGEALEELKRHVAEKLEDHGQDQD